MKFQEKIIFASIILIASVLRFWNYWNWSFTHDELGALVRLNYNSFSELLREGVQNGDTHPAFVQVFLFFWVKIFGSSEALVRLPFVLAGIGSVALIFFITKKWFNFTAACISSLAVSILSFPILYSQLARPYSFGLFFSMLAVWCWTNLLFGDGRKIFLKAFYFGTAIALCMYTHYFAFFFALIVAATGVFFLKRETWKPYLLSGAVAIIFFLPHISVSLHQFSKGGVGEWLAKPESDFLWKFILYCFNDSTFLFVSAIAISILGILIYQTEFSFSKFHFICLVWFLLPFAAGYYYSVHVNAVLQYSTLLFSFPFLPVFLFSFFKERNGKMNNYLFICLGLILIYSTIIEQKFYKKEVFGVFKEINLATLDLQKKYGEKNITSVLNTSRKDIFDYYFDRMNEHPSFSYIAGDAPDAVKRMRDKIDSCQTKYFLYGWSNFRSPYEISEMIKQKFPCVVYDEKHFNSQITLFGQNDSCKRDTVFYSSINFEKGKMNFEFDSASIDTMHFHSGKHTLRVNSKNEFCITLKTSVKNLFKENNIVNASAWIFPTDSFNTQMVIDIGAGTEHYWRSILLKPFVNAEKKWQEVFASFELPLSVFPDDEVKIYLWNPGKNTFYLDDFTVSSFADSRYYYYETSYRK